MGGRHCFLGSVAKSATVLGSQNCDSLQFLKLSRVILRNLSPHRLLLSYSLASKHTQIGRAISSH